MKPYDRPTLWSSELMIVRTYGCPVKIKNLWFDLMVVHVDGCLVDGCLLTQGWGNVHFWIMYQLNRYLCIGYNMPTLGG